MRTLIVATTLTAVVALAQPSFAEDMALGVWTGFGVRFNGNNQNRQPFRLEIKKVPDPYVAWRGGSGELISATVQVQNNQFDLSAIALGDGRLTFSFTHPDLAETVNCVLTREPKEGAYVGDCMERRVTLTPPAPAPPKPAGAAPAEAK